MRLLRSFDQICSFFCHAVEGTLQVCADLHREDRRIHDTEVCRIVHQQLCINHTLIMGSIKHGIKVQIR